MKKLIYTTIVLIVVFFPLIALATPAPTGTSGTLTNNSSFMVTGSGFGTKSPAAPTSYINFDGGTHGQEVNEANWTVDSYGDDHDPEYSNVRNYGTLEGAAALSSYQTDDSNSYMKSTLIGSTRDYYITWNEYRVNDSGSFNGKTFRNAVNCDEFIWSYSAQNHFCFYDKNGTCTYGSVQYYAQYFDEWTRKEAYLDRGTVGSANGETDVWTHRKAPPAISNWNHSSLSVLLSGGCVSDFVAVGQSFDGVDTDYVYIDNLYLDVGTQARVEIGDASTWAAVTEREIQIPTAWTDQSITFTVRQGEFGSAENVWIYVIDSDGAVNSTGFSVQYGEGEIIISPTQGIIPTGIIP